MKPKLELAEHNCCTPPEQSDTESGRAVLGERRFISPTVMFI